MDQQFYNKAQEVCANIRDNGFKSIQFECMNIVGVTESSILVMVWPRYPILDGDYIKFDKTSFFRDLRQFMRCELGPCAIVKSCGSILSLSVKKKKGLQCL